MSLFGGGERQTSPNQDSDFSISTIDDGERRGRARSSSYAAQLDGTDDNNGNEQQLGHNHEQDQGENQDHISMSGSPSAVSDASDTYLRPNRFRGSDRAWLHHTRDERQLSQSLDKLRANDLGLHLYSAHRLKADLRTTVPDVKPWSRKSRWVTANQDGDKPWFPDQDWTAWPLRPDIVPRGNETFGVLNDGLDSFSLHRKTDQRPRNDLQEQLHALLLRSANQMWKSRNPALNTVGHSHKMRKVAPVRPSPSRSTSTRPSSPFPTPVNPDSPPLSSMDQSIISVHPGTASQQLQDTQETITSTSDPVVKSEDVKHDQDEEFANPVLSADDDRSQRILHPTVSHIMSKLDGLLLALHQSREAQALRAREARDTSDSSAKSPSTSLPKSSKRPNYSGHAAIRRSRRRGRSTSGQGTPSDYVVFDDSGEDETYEPAEKLRESSSASSSESTPENAGDDLHLSRGIKRRPTTHRLGLRDWSEVLGIAAMTGWDSTVVERAQQRCRNLFGEDMQLYNLPEYGDSSADEAEATGAPQKTHSTQTGGWRCPLVNCPRHFNLLQHGYRWREHMRVAHKYEKDQVARLEEQLVQSGAIDVSKKRRTALAHNPRGWHPPDPLKCPHCPTAETIYPRISRLIDHIRRTHRYDPRIDAPPEEASDASGDRDSNAFSDDSDDGNISSDDYMVGGVHNDGFLQPVLRNAGVRGEDLARRLRRGNTRRSKLELKNAKKQRMYE